MRPTSLLSRRTFLAASAAAPLALSAAKKKPAVGLELYSVRDQLKQDLFGTVKAVAKMGYEGVEFYSPYFDWTPAYAKDVRKLLDDLNIKCYSTHNSSKSLDPENIAKAAELNNIIGSKAIIVASAGKVEGLDGWKGVAEKLNNGAHKLKSSKLRTGYHNHASEFKPIDGTMPLEVLAKNTEKNVILQFDIGTAVEMKIDCVGWINKNPGRIVSMHCKDYSPAAGRGYRVLFGEGAAPWKEIFAAAEKVGGVEYYLIEQEGSDFPPLETAEKCLATFKKIHA